MSMPDDAARDRYRDIGDLFHRALDLPPSERAAFLDSLHATHPTIAAEVASLVAAHARAAGFIEQPAVARDVLALTRGPLTVPTAPIGHYHVLSLIGEGGMGVVYLAEDTRLGRLVALKAVRPEYAGDANRTGRLRREARAAAALVHPNIATVYALEEIDGQLYVATEFIAGETVRSELARGPLPSPRAARVALGVARALQAAHTRGVVHRDLKPENIITTATSDVKVLDFGLAQFADPAGDDGLTKDGAVLGTPAYMSPEQIRGQAVDGRSDLFAWGVLVVELVTGRHPFLGPTSAATMARVLEERSPIAIDRACETADPVVRQLLQLADRCLAKSADERPVAADLIGPLESLAATPWPPHAAPMAAPLGAAHTSEQPAVLSPLRAVWWWQFHQAATAAAYLLLLVPLWRMRAGVANGSGRGLFLLALVAAVVAVMLRLHLWFALRHYPGEWVSDHHVARRLTRLADVVFALALAARGLVAVGADDPGATLLVAAAASVMVSFVIIEPATTRAMGRGRRSHSSRHPADIRPA